MKTTTSFFASIITIVLVTFIFQSAKSQNLFTNCDFETYSTLPTTQGQVSNAIGWEDVIQSSDYMNTSYPGWSPHLGLAHSGNGYMGFATYGNSTGSCEAIGQDVSATPMLPNTTYSVGVYAKMSSSGYYSQVCSGVTLYGYNVKPPLGTVSNHATFLAGATLLWTSNTVNSTSWKYFTDCFQSPNQTINYIVICLGNIANCPQYVYVDSISLVPGTANNFTLGSDITLCSGTSFTLDAGAGYATYLWQNGSGGQTFTGSGPGTYYVQVTTASGCVYKDTVVVSTGASNNFSIGNDTTICQGASFTLDAGSGYASYLWQNGSGNQTFSISNSGTYYVQATTAFGCVYKDTILVTLVNGNLSLGNDQILCQGTSFTLDAGTGYTNYLWQDGSGNQAFSGNNAGNYYAQVTSTKGCVYRDTVNITFKNCDSIIATTCGILGIPNAFSPNQDNENDHFCLEGWAICNEYFTITIYDRWGEKVYESNDPNFCWDGKYKGQTEDAQVFVYSIKAKFSNSPIIVFKKGNISLIK